MILYSALAYAVFVGSFLYSVGWLGDVPGLPTNIDGQPGRPLLEALAIDLALLSLFAVQHSVMARPGFKKVWTRIIPAAAERSTYVLLSSVCLFAICLGWQSLPGSVWRLSGPAATLAWGGYALGWLVVFLSTFMIDHFALFGLKRQGAPEFQVRWLYRVVRHPIMLGFVIAFWSAPSMSSGRLAFAIVTTAYILVALQLEERDLRSVFGATYDRYRERVPMLIPFLRARGAREERSTRPAASS